ncbi:MAG: sugar phosphate isomerase/epimerase [Phycisphaerae bacterium]|nr:sugar phosphate isomerase/epimerase [Phycisphaerae bacterium]NUQ46599.1 sugar phosphate isomerase/epimerase [Phycisphaerae bacterium]
MMTLGTTGAFGFEDFHPPEVLGLYAQAGCTIVQVYRNRLRHITSRDILAMMPDEPLTIDSIHGVFGDDLDPSSEDEAFRRQTVDTYKREADFCRELGGDLVVVHPCPARAAVGSLEAKYAQLRRSFDELGRFGDQVGVTFAFENMPPYHPVGYDVERLVREIAAAAASRIVFLLDTGHAHMTCGIGNAVRLAGDNLRYTHVHDNDGKIDNHMLPYRGTLPWDELRDAIHEVRYDGVFLLEVFEKARDLRRLLNDRWKSDIGRILNNSHAD